MQDEDGYIPPKCPVCKSKDTEVIQVKDYDDRTIKSIKCNDCGSTWDSKEVIIPDAPFSLN